MRRLTTRRPLVAMVTGPGVSVFELAAAWEVFGTDFSYLGVPWYRSVLCSAAEPPFATQMPGLTITDVEPLTALRRAGTVVVPPMTQKDPELFAALRQAHRRGARILSLCTGAFVLAEAGLLDGRTATTHWSQTSNLAKRYPSINVDPCVLYVDGQDILTSAGSAACIDLCLHIVQRDFGAHVANEVARELVMPPHRSGGQAQFISSPIPTASGVDLFAGTLEWAASHLDDDLSVEQLAHRAAMSSRTFARRFRESIGMTPHQWVLRQRVLLAQRLLETTDLAVDQVADASGLGSATNMRTQFRGVLGTSPTSYRRTFQTHAG
ncbi:MAG TPA: helix-turn-helix domain-containing protein [Acidimicrobiales bacterium]|nr:helix-turn-helix domain-containing protein [Acidimicrobiales bacterium]